MLDEAAHKSKHDVEQLVARVRPRPAVPSTIRKLPERFPSSLPPAPAPAQNAVPPTAIATAAVARPAPPVQPLAPDRYRVQFTVSGDTREKLRRVQDLMRHTIPNGDVAAIFDRALSVFLETLEKRKVGMTKRPRSTPERGSSSRRAPARVRREVWNRDGGRCAFIGPNGRCTERGFLEFHHVKPHAVGGPTVVENIELRCKAHNLYESDLFFAERPSQFAREARPMWPVRTCDPAGTGPGTSGAVARLYLHQRASRAMSRSPT